MKNVLSLILAFVFCAVPLAVFAEEAGTVSEDYDPMWQLTEPYGFKFGGAFSYDDMRNQVFMDFLARHFNSVTCCNETKAYSLLDEGASKSAKDGMPCMTYSRADAMLTWAQQNGRNNVCRMLSS